MNRIKTGIFWALVLVAGATLPARAEDRLTWLSVEEAPLPGGVGGDAAAGISTLGIDWFSATIPGFEHHRESGTVLRVLDLISTKDGYCAPEFYKTPERESVMLFSTAMGRDVPHRLAVLKSRLGPILPYLDAQGRVRLSDLLKDAKLRGVREAGSTLGADLDPLFADRGANVEASVHMEFSFHQLAAGRIDWVIADALEMSLHISRLPQPSDLATLAIAEQPGLLVYYVICSNGPIGRKAVQAVNRSLIAAGNPPFWQQRYIDLLDPDSRREYDRLISQSAKQ